jgi:hypothetical protein
VPDFLVTIRAEDGRLPPDLSIAVEFGGGNEVITVSRTTQGQITFCSFLPAELGEGGQSGDGGGAGGPAAGLAAYSALECELWTEGPATVRLTASGFQPLERELRVDADDCTTAVELELTAKQPPL